MSDDGNISVFFLGLWEAKPVYHFDGTVRMTDEGREWLTACGRKWGTLSDTGRVWQTHIIPLRHARKFGRECKTCAGAFSNGEPQP